MKRLALILLMLFPGVAWGQTTSPIGLGPNNRLTSPTVGQIRHVTTTNAGFIQTHDPGTIDTEGLAPDWNTSCTVYADVSAPSDSRDNVVWRFGSNMAGNGQPQVAGEPVLCEEFESSYYVNAKRSVERHSTFIDTGGVTHRYMTWAIPHDGTDAAANGAIAIEKFSFNDFDGNQRLLFDWVNENINIVESAVYIKKQNNNVAWLKQRNAADSLDLSLPYINSSDVLQFSQNLALSGNWLSGDGGSEGVFVTSAGLVGVGLSTLSTKKLTVSGAIAMTDTGSTTVRSYVGPPSWDESYTSFQTAALAESAANSAMNQSGSGDTVINAASGRTLFLRTNNGLGARLGGVSWKFDDGIDLVFGTTNDAGLTKIADGVIAATTGATATTGGELLFESRVIADTDGGTQAEADVQGQIYVNTGDADGQTFNLPAAAAGMRVTFYCTEAQNLVVNPDNADIILGLTNAAGDSITGNAIGESVTLVAIDATNWAAVSVVGTWADSD